jgi:hypothetical protein
MKNKIKNILKEIKERIVSPVFWLGVGSIVSIIFQTAGIKFEEMTSWEVLLDNIITIISNPYMVISILVAVFSFLNNPKNQKGF